MAGRTLFSAAALGFVAFAILRATDEATATNATRGARLLAMAPALTALAVMIVAGRAERAGDLGSLRCVGVSRARGLRGAVVPASLLGLACAGLLLLGVGSLAGLFPPAAGDVWTVSGDGFVGPGVSLTEPFGELRFLDPRPTPRVAERAKVAAAIALLAIALPAWGAARESAGRRASVATLLVSGSVTAFHAVSLGTPAGALLAVPLALLAYLGLRSLGHGGAHG